MLHRAAITPRACSVLAQMGSLGTSDGGLQEKWRAMPSTAGFLVVAAAKTDSLDVVYGSNGQRPRRASLTW